MDELSADGGQDRFREKVGLPSRPTSRARRSSGSSTTSRVRGGRRGRRPRVRQHGHLGDLEPHRWHGRRRARHRRLERQPHDADGPRDARLGRRAARAFGIPRSMLPRSSPRRRCTAKRPARWRASRWPATSVTSRRRTFGQAAYDIGDAKNTYGTGNFMLLNTGDRHRASPRADCSPRSVGSSATRRRSTAWRARSRSPARSCSGSGTTWA